MEFYDGINSGLIYVCDRCNVTSLREDEFLKNIKKDYKYCDECYTWLHLQRWKDDKGNTYTLRSERKIDENN